MSHFAGDPLAVADEYISDFQDDVEVQIYTDFRRLVTEAPVTAVNDFTSHALHHQVAEIALRADKDLLTEKPMAVSVRAARRMCELAEARQRVLGVFQSGRHARAPPPAMALQLRPARRLQLMLIGSVGGAGPRTSWWPTRPAPPARGRGRDRSGRRRASFRLDPRLGRRDPRHPGPHRHRRAGARGHDVQGRLTQRVACDAEDTVYASFATAAGTTGELTASWAGRGGGTMPGGGDVYYASPRTRLW